MAHPPIRIALVAGRDSPPLAPAAEALRDHAEVEVIDGTAHDSAPSRDSTYSEDHWWSIGVLQALRRVYGDRGPDIVEAPDRGGAAAVALQAKLTLDPLFATTVFRLRLEGTREMTDVLDGAVAEGFEAGVDHDLERYALRHADRLLAGPAVMDAYRSFYGDEGLARPLDVLPARAPLEAAGAPSPGPPLRLFCPGPIGRRQGVADLVSAVLGLERDDWQLTICGPDTPTGPIARSMREVLELQIAGDPRIVFEDTLQRESLPSCMAGHHAAVLASGFEADPSMALDVMACNRPVLATDGGVFSGLVGEDVGWLVPPGDPIALREAITRLLDHPEAVAEMITSQRPRRRCLELLGPAARNRQAMGLTPRPRRAPREGPGADALVSVVIPYHGLSEHLPETVASALASTYPHLEVTIVNDGSFEPEDEVLLRLERTPGVQVVHQVNAGPAAARNLGFALARGTYVLPLDADDILAPEFIERGVRVLDARPEYAYVTCWARHMEADGSLTDRAFPFLGNECRSVMDENVAGTPTSLLRAEHLGPGRGYTDDLVTHEDWLFYRTMRQRGLYGQVIPEFLFFYRVREGSMSETMLWPHSPRLAREVRARGREREVAWST